MNDYPLVKITNSTAYVVEGEVKYCSVFCSNDNYIVAAGTSWEAKSRGVCLVKEITATVNVNGNKIKAESYESSGTSYSQFAVVNMGDNKFSVTRVVNGEKDTPPVDYIEPTSQQK